MENVESRMKKKSFLYKHEDFCSLLCLFSYIMMMEKGLFYLNCSNIKGANNADMISDRDSLKSSDYEGEIKYKSY